MGGEMTETSKKAVLRAVRRQRWPAADDGQVAQADSIEETENSEDSLGRIGSRS